MSKAKLIEKIQNDELNCPRCCSNNIRKAGSRQNKKQYKYNDINKQQTVKLDNP